jgi:hypothetical protein
MLPLVGIVRCCYYYHWYVVVLQIVDDFLADKWYK